MGNRIAISIAFLLLGGSCCQTAAVAGDASPPGAYHLSFDSWAFLADDYSAAFAEPNLDQRRLELVPGQFGQGLYNRNEFVPADFQRTHMSTRDLDVLLSVLCHHRFAYWKEGLSVGGMQPYFWGTGRLTIDSGTVAFWAKGGRAQPGPLFFQGSSSFGRLEKDLIVVALNENGSLAACLVDARYQRHAVESAPLWNDERWNHVALIWDRSQGLRLLLNGRVVASNWGDDAWWTGQVPGLFHLPMGGLLVDELWVFDYPLGAGDIERLIQENRPPPDGRTAPPIDQAAARRLQRAFVGPSTALLPRVGPSAGRSCTVFREILPLAAHDGCVKMPCVMDGRYEMAWPMGYTSFTNILGDSDFLAEKVDFQLPEAERVNYITCQGDLSEVRVLAGQQADAGRTEDMREVLTVPDGEQFFHGQQLEPVRVPVFRIPLPPRRGSPPGYEPGLDLPLPGVSRIHEVAFFHVGQESLLDGRPGLWTLRVGDRVTPPADGRFGYAMRALNDRRNAAVHLASARSDTPVRWIPLEPFTRLNLLSEPFADAQTVKAVTLNLHVRHAVDDDIVIIRLHDAGMPARIWTSVVFALQGFDPAGGMLSVRLDVTDIRAAAGDRLWMDVAQSGRAEVEFGGTAASCLQVETAPLGAAEPGYGFKALQPALSSFAKIYTWYYPWIATGRQPHVDNPVTFGGYYDIASYPLMVLRTDPEHFLANTLADLALIKRPVKSEFRPATWENSPQFWPPLPVAKADTSPEWAFFLHHYLAGYERIVHWWSDRQNPDGQVGGGWNDDVLFAARLTGPFLYSGDRKAQRMFDRIFQGLDRTRLFDDGYCRVHPIDPMHAIDLVRHRYEGLLFHPGDPYKMGVSMRTAWRFGKPEETPLNYADGEPFQYDRDVVLWYWGRTPEYPAYAASGADVTAVAKRFAPAMNDVIHFRYTESGMFTDGSAVPGSAEIKRILVGGDCGPFLNQLTLAATWEEGGGPSIPKWIEHASASRFVAHLYSYDAVERNVTVRLCRLKKGIYRITLAGVGPPGSSRPTLCRRSELRRFSRITIPVRPRSALVLRVDCERPLPDPQPLPDLAVRCVEEVDGRLRAEIVNFGAAAAGPCLVHLEDACGRTLAAQEVAGLKSAEDFDPGHVRIEFPVTGAPPSACRVIVDPENTIEEILEENNQAGLADGGD